MNSNLVELIQYINKFKHINRLSLISEGGRRESDAEHTWHLVMTLWILSELYEKKVDMNKVIKMALVHDLPEMIAGDVFAHAQGDAKEMKKAREEKALDQIASKMPRNFANELILLWNEYEARESEEAKFVWLSDKLMPRVMHKLTNGDLSDKLEYDKQDDINQMNKMADMSELFKEILKQI